jgi:hypothetical protein
MKKEDCAMVDLGYHYTTPRSLQLIQTKGLSTGRKGEQEGIESNNNGTHYGDGIYTCDNPTKYRGRFGPVRLLVARLKGQCTASVDVTDMTYIRKSLAVLRSSTQCLPLVPFTCEPNDLVILHHY